MNDMSPTEMTAEDRLKAVLYQFVSLYERWSEDRQIAAKQGADIKDIISVFIEQLNHLKNLTPQVRQQLLGSVQTSAREAIKTISETIGKEATGAVEATARQLANTVEKVQQTLTAYQYEVVNTQWKIILSTMVTTLAASLLIFWLFMPKPVLPLTDKQIKDLRSGQLMSLVWPKLSQQERQHWLKLADEVQYPQAQSTSEE